MTARDGDFKNLVDGVLGIAVPTCGETVEYRPRRGGKIQISAVFDEYSDQVDPETEAIVSVRAPKIGVRLRDIPGTPDKGDTVRVLERMFDVDMVEEDGQGGATIWLGEKDVNPT